MELELDDSIFIELLNDPAACSDNTLGSHLPAPLSDDAASSRRHLPNSSGTSNAAVGRKGNAQQHYSEQRCKHCGEPNRWEINELDGARRPAVASAKPGTASVLRSYRQRHQEQRRHIASLESDLSKARASLAKREGLLTTLKRQLRDSKPSAPVSPVVLRDTSENPRLPSPDMNDVEGGITPDAKELVAELRARDKRARQVIGQLRARVAEGQEEAALLSREAAAGRDAASKLERSLDEVRHKLRASERTVRHNLSEHEALVQEHAEATAALASKDSELREAWGHAALVTSKLEALRHLCRQLERENAGHRAECQNLREDLASIAVERPPAPPARPCFPTARLQAEEAHHSISSPRKKGGGDYDGLASMYERVYGKRR